MFSLKSLARKGLIIFLYVSWSKFSSTVRSMELQVQYNYMKNLVYIYVSSEIIIVCFSFASSPVNMLHTNQLNDSISDRKIVFCSAVLWTICVPSLLSEIPIVFWMWYFVGEI